jgi:hypothetical protein
MSVGAASDFKNLRNLRSGFLIAKTGAVIICFNLAVLADRDFTIQPSAYRMKQQEAKPLIIREWDLWIQTQSINSRKASARDSFKFFLELQEARFPLLDFQPRGRDKWQIVHAWLLSEGRVSN